MTQEDNFSSFESWQQYYLPNFVLEYEKSQMQLPMDSFASYLAENFTNKILKSLEEDKHQTNE